MKYLLIIPFVIQLAYQTASASDAWTSETHKKHASLVKAGIESDVAKHLIDECKATAKDTVNCIKIGASVLGAESSGGQFCRNNNCVGMNDGSVGYASREAGIDAWVGKYNRFWYKQKTPASFYSGTKGIVPKTRYCMGVKKDGFCPEGAKNSWGVFNKLDF